MSNSKGIYIYIQTSNSGLPFSHCIGRQSRHNQPRMKREETDKAHQIHERQLRICENLSAPSSPFFPLPSLPWWCARRGRRKDLPQSGNSLVVRREWMPWLLTPASRLNRLGSQSASKGAPGDSWDYFGAEQERAMTMSGRQ